MWNKDRSIVLSQVLVRLCYAAMAVCVIAVPKLVKLYETTAEAQSISGVYTPLIISIYACVPSEVTALVCLDLLLRNIKNNRAFVNQNVKLLRILSFCCFYVAAVLIYISVLRPFIFLFVFAAGFLGIILRVVKNCFQQAIAIREENDFTV